MLPVMAIANHKGGVGKSTTSMMIAEGAALFGGLRVLVLDLDPQGALSRMLMGDDAVDMAARNQRTVLDLLRGFAVSGEMSLPPVVVQNVSDLKELQSAPGGARIDLVPSHRSSLIEMAGVETLIRTHDPKARLDELIGRALKLELDRIGRFYHLVILDCPAGPVAISLAALRACSLVVAPTVLEKNSLSALCDFIRLILDQDLGIYESISSRAHMLVTMFVRSNSVQQVLLDHIERGRSELNALPIAIPHSTAIQRAASHPGPNAHRLAREKYNSAYGEFEALAICIRDILLAARRESASRVDPHSRAPRQHHRG
jgi:chromosome partitioning protein